MRFSNEAYFFSPVLDVKIVDGYPERKSQPGKRDVELMLHRTNCNMTLISQKCTPYMRLGLPPKRDGNFVNK
jgi:hypothetical protein